jgi:hypothetical protein
MFTCCTIDSLGINLINSGQLQFSHIHVNRPLLCGRRLPSSEFKQTWLKASNSDNAILFSIKNHLNVCQTMISIGQKQLSAFFHRIEFAELTFCPIFLADFASKGPTIRVPLFDSKELPAPTPLSPPPLNRECTCAHLLGITPSPRQKKVHLRVKKGKFWWNNLF